ncbi:MAG TPA: response regulator transcription factor [Candidatus Eisenbacteria bacterium]|jgi:DNA-binding winged helix-turn-helix (wHTH) protein|nr:response regulator transcription factor [Candidatus Eisenbacteria bacterium]
MGVVANNPIQELLPAAARHVNNSVTPIRIVGLEEARSIEQFVPVIVLLPASANGQANSIRQTGNNSVSGTSTASAIFELFGRGGKLPSLTNAESELVFGDVKVNFSSMETTRKGQPVTLTAMEFKTLKFMAQNARRVISRDELLNEVWGYENYPSTRTVDNHILRLRRKLERDPSRPIHFRTVHRAGYKFLLESPATGRESACDLAVHKR